jgi:hypothetical protein
MVGVICANSGWSLISRTTLTLRLRWRHGCVLFLGVPAHEEEPAATGEQQHEHCGAAHHNEFAFAFRSSGFRALLDLIVVCHCPCPQSWDGLDAAELALNDAIQRPPARERPVSAR